jgi:hypothetical protein
MIELHLRGEQMTKRRVGVEVVKEENNVYLKIQLPDSIRRTLLKPKKQRNKKSRLIHQLESKVLHPTARFIRGVD